VYNLVAIKLDECQSNLRQHSNDILCSPGRLFLFILDVFVKITANHIICNQKVLALSVVVEVVHH
jgi:hypothetical protein